MTRQSRPGGQGRGQRRGQERGEDCGQERATIGDNGGPPLEETPPHEPEWGKGGINRYFEWRTAFRKAWRKPPAIALRRQERAEALGLTYEEYTLELMERGAHPQPQDVAAIKARRPERRRAGGLVGQSLKGLRLK